MKGRTEKFKRKFYLSQSDMNLNSLNLSLNLSFLCGEGETLCLLFHGSLFHGSCPCAVCHFRLLDLGTCPAFLRLLSPSSLVNSIILTELQISLGALTALTRPLDYI